MSQDGQALYQAMAAGVAIGLLVLAAVVMQDVLLDVLRAIWRGVKWLARHIPVAARGHVAPSAGQLAALVGRLPRGVGAMLATAFARVQALRTISNAIEEEAVAEPVLIPLTRLDAPPRQESELQRSRQYSPSSSIHVEERVREVLSRRGGPTPLDILVRDLDRQFGSGLGLGLLESLRTRGRVRLVRNLARPTEIAVELIEPAASGDRAR